MRASVIVAVVIGTSLALGGCTAPDPGLSPEPSPPSESPHTESLAVDVSFAHSQPTELTLISESHTLTLSGGDPALDAVLGQLVSGELHPVDPDYTNLWEAGAVVSTRRSGDLLTVDLTRVTMTVGAEAEGIALAQLVWTAVAIDPSIAAVQLTIDGTVVDTLAGHADISAPVRASAPESVLTPVQIAAPAEGARVMSPVTAIGVACVFEATVHWRLDGPEGAVRQGSTMAAEACPARAEWRLELGDLPPGDYLLTVSEISPMDGSVSTSDSKAFTVAL